MRLAVPDLVSNSYFPAVAAVELGFFREQGLDVELEMVFPIGKAMEYAARRPDRLRRRARPTPPCPHSRDGRGAKLLAALSQHTFWVLVLSSNLGVQAWATWQPSGGFASARLQARTLHFGDLLAEAGH